MNSDLFIGLMTGTSVDALDAALVRFDNGSSKLEQTLEFPLHDRLRHRLQALIAEPSEAGLDAIGTAGRELANAATTAVASLLDAHGTPASAVTAIGFHGQTVRHLPAGQTGFTLQLGDAAALAVQTGIDVVSDFRSADVALGGQGAPLAPGFHDYAFRAAEPRVIVNIGGIANITLLLPGEPTRGYDTGPGNTLLDAWSRLHTGKDFDAGGAWAARGEVIPSLLDSMRSDPYFALPGPKSTGREHFNPAWLQRHLDATDGTPAAVDVQATLAALTASTILAALESESTGNATDARLFVCGGGARNTFLMQRLDEMHPGAVATTAELGVPPDQVEATAFAWLARARLRGEPGNLPAVTGARRAAILGALHRH